MNERRRHAVAQESHNFKARQTLFWRFWPIGIVLVYRVCDNPIVLLNNRHEQPKWSNTKYLHVLFRCWLHLWPLQANDHISGWTWRWKHNQLFGLNTKQSFGQIQQNVNAVVPWSVNPRWEQKRCIYPDTQQYRYRYRVGLAIWLFLSSFYRSLAYQESFRSVIPKIIKISTFACKQDVCVKIDFKDGATQRWTQPGRCTDLREQDVILQSSCPGTPLRHRKTHHWCGYQSQSCIHRHTAGPSCHRHSGCSVQHSDLVNNLERQRMILLRYCF